MRCTSQQISRVDGVCVLARRSSSLIHRRTCLSTVSDRAFRSPVRAFGTAYSRIISPSLVAGFSKSPKNNAPFQALLSPYYQAGIKAGVVPRQGIAQPYPIRPSPSPPHNGIIEIPHRPHHLHCGWQAGAVCCQIQ